MQVIFIVALTTALLTGCAVGPDFHAPAAPHVKQYTEAASESAAEVPALRPGGDIPEQWWRVYHNKELTRLIHLAITQSPNLAAARATLRSAQENYAAQSGTILYPTVDAAISTDRQKVSGVAFGQAGGFMYTLHHASVNVSYAFDPFGGGRRYLESLRAQVDYQGYQMEAAHLTLAANIVTAAIAEASLRGQWQAARDIVENRRAQLNIVQRQAALGALADADVLSQRTALAQAETALPPLEKQLAQIRHQISVLSGRFPGAGLAPVFELDGLQMPQSIPLSLPSELVRQRPDIRAAEAQLHQASALVGLATANLYPSLKITAGFGRQSIQFGDLLTGPADGVWRLGASLLQPLFHGGELTAKRRQTLADFDAARAHYRQTLLQAFRDVADALQALHSDARALTLQQRAESLAGQTQALVQHRFDLGAASFLSLLNAQEQFRQSHIGAVQARAALLADSAALFQAMGGGWWHSRDAYRPVAGNADFFNAWQQVEAVHESQ